MKTARSWILVADGQRAQVYRSDGWGHGLQAVDGKHFERKLPPSRDLGTDKPGRVFSSAQGRPSAVGEPDALHRAAKERFMKSVAGMLDDGARADAFARLVIVAPPEALGEIRATLSEMAKKRVVAEVNKDLTHLPLPTLEKQLASVVPV